MLKPTTLRHAWTAHVTAADYEAHMANVGQAQANAELVETLFRLATPPGHRILIPGAGPGQMFDYLDPAVLAGHDITFTDLNPDFLGRLADRLAAAPFAHRELLDDLENTALDGPFDAAILVLVLEHICWPNGIASLARLGIPRCYIVIQQNPEGLAPAVTPGRQVPGSMQIFREVHPKLVPRDQLIEAMEEAGYRLTGEQSRPVPDDKQMILLVFTRKIE
ncbi:MAG: hypothetical protein NTY38_13385 [Acidobacteria bacterium]|nr:hypothetical protein [Acidobacteriota bacterium]